MRQIGLRQFQQNLHKELQNLPVTITKKGEPVYVVTSFSDNVVTSKYEGEKGELYEVAVPDKEWEGKCQAPNQYCKQFGKKYSITFDSEDGERTIDQYLCSNHLVVVQQQAILVEEVI